MLEFIIANNIVPEVFLTFGAMVLTIFGSSKKECTSRVFLFFTFLLCVVLGVLVSDFQNEETTKSLFGFFIINQYIVFAKVMIAALAGFCILLAMGYNKKQLLFRSSEFSILVLLSVLGMFVMLSANDLFVMYCGMELQAIALYVLTACDRDNLSSSEAAMKYFIVGAIASIILLYGISLVFGFTGTTNFSTLVDQVYNGYENGHMIPVGFYIGTSLIIIAICIKIAVAPFHFWAPDVYQGAPLPVTAILSILPKAALILFAARLFYTVLYPWMFNFNFLLQIISVFSLFVGALAALKQKNIKRLLAYSSISHVGFILMGLVSETTLGISAVIFYIIIYSFMTLGIFAFIAIIQRTSGEENFDLSMFSGLAKEHPVIALSISIMLLSMAGFPPLAGFLAKFYIIVSVMNSKLYLIATMGLISSVISTYYYLRIIKLMYFDKKTVEGQIYNISTENVIVATFATVFNLVLVLSPAGINSLVLIVSNNLLK